MDRSSAVAGLGLLVVGLLVGAGAAQVAGPDPGGESTPSPEPGRLADLDGRTVKVDGSVLGFDEGRFRVNVTGSEPIELHVGEDSEAFRCETRGGILTCDGGLAFDSIERGASVCVDVRSTDGRLVVVRAFVGTSCSVAPA